MGQCFLSHVIEHVNQPVALLTEYKTLLTENRKTNRQCTSGKNPRRFCYSRKLLQSTPTKV